MPLAGICSAAVQHKKQLSLLPANAADWIASSSVCALTDGEAKLACFRNTCLLVVCLCPACLGHAASSHQVVRVCSLRSPWLRGLSCRLCW